MAEKNLEKLEEVALPRKGETVAIATKEKTAALCYDRILIPRVGFEELIKTPKEIRCYGNSPIEQTLLQSINLATKIKTIKEQGSSEDLKKIMTEVFDKFPQMLNAIIGKQHLPSKAKINDLKNFNESLRTNPLLLADSMIRNVAKSFSTKYKVPVTLVYKSKSERDAQYHEGNRAAVIATLSDLRICDEEQITWEQVIEFRKDKEAREKYKRLLHWLDKEMIGKSQAFIKDEISQKLADYEWTLKKHGIKTVLGTIEEALDGKYLLGAGVLGLASGSSTLGLLAGGILIGGKIIVKLIQTKFDFEDVECARNSEISWVYEVKKKLARKPKPLHKI